MINIAICDDDKIQLESIRQITEKNCGFACNVFSFSNAQQLVEFARGKKADIVLLDIVLNNINGIDTAKELLKLNPDTIIIFMSGYDGYFEDVYSVEHIYFLIKPIKEDKLRAALDKAYARYTACAEKNIYIKYKSSIAAVDLSKVLFFESRSRNIIIKYPSEQLCIPYMKLDSIFGMINPPYSDIFIRCHQSFIINMSKVKQIHKNAAVFGDAVKIPISRKYQKYVMEKYMIMLGGCV